MRVFDKKKLTIQHHIYMSKVEKEQLMKLCAKRNESKSAVIRKLIASTKYLHTLEQIELFNKIATDLLYELTKCGININQIAYHLNIDVTKESEAKSDFLKAFWQFKNAIDEYKEQFENGKIELVLNQTRMTKKAKKAIEYE